MAPLKWSPNELPSLEGRTYLVTGGNTGIGYWTVYHLALRGASVYLTSRSEEKGLDAIGKIRVAISKVDQAIQPQLRLLIMDLMSLTSVLAAAKRVRSECSQLHGLVNSAGIMATPYLLSEDGYESQFQTNYLSHWLLTYHLLPLLETTAQSNPEGTVRIVNVSSMGHAATLKEGITFEDTSLKEKFTFRRYAQSKLGNVLHARSLHERYSTLSNNTKIWSMSLHPGNVDTQLNVKTLGGSTLTPILRCLGTYITPEEGSYNSLWALAGVDVRVEHSGKYFIPVAVEKKPSKQASDEKLAKRLWEWTESEMERKGLLAMI
jgi:NAD(P)-dependent dehydrogenase (short-subunit alcohol dehydrogenase family)